MGQPDWMNLNQMGFAPQAQGGNTFPNSPLLSDEDRAAMARALAAKQAAEKAQRVQLPPQSQEPDIDPALQYHQPASATISPEDRAMRADLSAKFKQLVQGSEQGLEQGKQNLQDVRNLPPGVNFAPIAALADKWGGGGNQLSSAAASIRGMSPEEKAQLIAKLEAQQTDKQEKLTNIVGARLDKADQSKLALQLASEANKNDRFKYAQDKAGLMKLNGDLRNDTKDFTEITKAYDTVSANLQPDAQGTVSAQRLKNSLSLASRALGEKGVLTDQDIARVQIKNFDTAIADLETKFGNTDARIPVATVQPLLASMAAGKQAWQGAAQKRINATRDTHITLGVDPLRANHIANNIYGQLLGTHGPGGHAVDSAPAQGDAKAQADDILKKMGY